MSDEEVFGDDAEGTSEFAQLSDREIALELALPDSLKDLSRKDREELLVFKRTRNEIDYEEELLALQEKKQLGTDIQKLTRMNLGKTQIAEAKNKVGKGKGKGNGKGKDMFEDSDDESDLGDIRQSYTGGLDGILNTNTSTLSMEFRTYTNGFG